MDKKMRYVEPENYIPEEIQKKYGVGKYYKEENADEPTKEVTFEEAFEIAKELKEKIDYCDETGNAFIFGAEEERYTIGGNSPVVVIKADGKAIDMTHYVSFYPNSETIRTIDLSGR